MRPFSLMLVLSLFVAVASRGGTLDELRQALEQSSVAQVQEKVYIHTDNTCYFVGDTLWYKAYVVRADNLRPTDMSRILYVELLSPDGLLVERQSIIVSSDGYTCGQFELRDSLYSGYYELRAYTRWMLNFNVRHHRYSTHDTWHFYSRQMADDYFRIWDGLYSRVFPVYSKPDLTGDYDMRRMYQRPKTRLPKEKKPDLNVTFYPEGGHLVRGVKNRVAFEAVDQHGAAVTVNGTVTSDGQTVANAMTEHMGRGIFTVTPGVKRLKAHFVYNDKQYNFNLPDIEDEGATLQVGSDGNVTIGTHQLPQDRQYGVSVLCGGVLKHFAEVVLPANGQVAVSLPVDSLPPGVADVTLFDSDGRIWADRLAFFSMGKLMNLTPVEAVNALPANHTFAPYEAIELTLQLPVPNTTFSLSVRDTNTDEPTYDDGNILTSLLLSSELKGFIANPAYYFQSDDETHRRHLDLLMMVQGWRKYKWEELADTTRQLRYAPEYTLTIEGSVYKMLGINPVEPDEISEWQDGVGMLARRTSFSDDQEDPWAETGEDDASSTEQPAAPQISEMPITTMELGDIGSANDNVGVNHRGLRREVLVEAEVSRDGTVVGSVQKTTNGGHFVFEVPPFYGYAWLNMKAYKENDSIKKNMLSRKDAKVLDEDEFPDFYVKRDLFFPMTTIDYSYYQKHQPAFSTEQLIDTLSALSMENDVYQLRNINVKGHRRGRRAIDWRKPAFVLDAYDLYNDITDYGLSFGKVDMRQFPVQVCRYLFGNMNRYNSFRVDGRIDGAVYYRNYDPDPSEMAAEGRFRANRTSQSLYKKLKMSRLQDVRVFSDYEPRTEDSTMVEEYYTADATVEMVNIPDDGKQITFRDRHILLHGINEPESFYRPDYSERPVGGFPDDYRRTLYWDPNAVAGDDGRYTAVFYNNSKETRIKMTAVGVTGDGQLLFSR